MAGTVETANFTFGRNRNLLYYGKPSGRWLSALLAMVMVSTVLFFLNSFWLTLGINIISGDPFLQVGPWIFSLSLPFSVWAVLFCAIAASRALVGFLSGMLRQRCVEENALALKAELFARAQNAPFLEVLDTGDVMTRLTRDADEVAGIVPGPLLALFENIFSVSLALALCFLLSWRLSLLLCATVPLSVWISWAYGSKIQRKAVEKGNAEGKMRAYLQENLGILSTIKIFTRESAVVDGMSRLNQARANAACALTRESALQFCLSNWAGYLSIIATLVTGAWFVSTDRLLVSTLLGFLFVSQSGVIWPISDIPGHFATLFEKKGAKERLESATWPEVLPTQIASADFTPVRLVCDSVSFSYEEGSEVLQEVSFSLPFGESACLSGPSGVGKSTLVYLLLGLLKPSAGDIWFESESERISPEQARYLVAYVPQGFSLFSGTIAENIRAGHLGATDAQVRESATAAGADAFIEALPDGYVTTIGTGGSSLSVGQAQRVAIARALLSGRPILLLDEPSSALDDEAEQVIIDTLGRLRGKRTCLLVSHRPTLVAYAQREISLIPRPPRDALEDWPNEP